MFIYFFFFRFEDIKQEGILLEAHQKRKINKSHKTIDYSELEYTPHRKGSGDSLGSQRSLDSQHSSDSHSSVTVRELNKNSSMSRKFEQWSSTSTRSETDSESGITHSAPPVVDHKGSVYKEFVPDELWHRHSDPDYLQKTQLTRTPQVSSRAQLKRETRYVNDNVRSTPEGLKSFPPIRRPTTREIPKFPAGESEFSARDIYCGYDHAPSKAEEILGKPEAPLRNTRKPKRSHVKSLGEEVTDSSSLDKNQFLTTIDESKVIHPDITARLKSSQKDESSSNFLIAEKEFSGGTPKQSLTPKRQRSGLAMEVRRRNSDPATKVTLSEHPTGAESSPQIKEWENPNSFTMAGHRFRKINRFSKDDKCAFCNQQMDPFYTQGHKCTDCKRLFHPKCIQNKSVLEMPCDCKHHSSGGDSGKPGRRKYRKHSRTPYDLNKHALVSKFSLTGTSEFTDRTDQIISDANELQLMQDFITSKICAIENLAGENPSDVDRLFKQALREFKDNLVQFYSAAKGYECTIKYKDLIKNFMQAMETVCQREMKDKDFPVTMGVNAFRGFMNEFMSSRNEAEKPNKMKRKKDKKRKGDDTIKFGSHTFLWTIINIPTACEICNSFFMWPIERGLVCQSCKLTCHKKCHRKATVNCAKEANLSCERNKVFGVPLATLLTEETKVPLVIEKLLTAIEMSGTYAEGIYRKSGVSSKIRELKAKMEENPEEVSFEDYQVHVLASVFKSFLREMPEPLLTFECYENFIMAANLDDPQDRVTTLHDILKKLPPANFHMVERLIFHLARIALHEEVNRMSPASLAIVFAPCILRTNKMVPAQDSLHDIGSQTQCIETIIKDKVSRISENRSFHNSVLHVQGVSLVLNFSVSSLVVLYRKSTKINLTSFLKHIYRKLYDFFLSENFFI